MNQENIRNIAIIAHIDHGKTTLVDCLLRQTDPNIRNLDERAMDSNDLEKERGITILAKSASINYKDHLIQVVDTPGHGDFSAEVERILGMVDGCLILVDAAEGPMAQTRFVLQKALEKKLQPILVINKIDRPDQRVDQVIDEVLDLFIALDADDDQLEFSTVFCSAKNGIAGLSMDDIQESVTPLLDTIIEQVPPPKGDRNKPLQLQVTNLEHDDYIGKLVLGRIINGSVKKGEQVSYGSSPDKIHNGQIRKILGFEGMNRVELDEAGSGYIILLAGLTEAELGDTVGPRDELELLPSIDIDEPTLGMTFMTNDSPFVGLDGKYVTSRHLGDRLEKEKKRNIGLRIEQGDTPDQFIVSGRGELHLSILLENLRREGFELAVSPPRVLFKDTGSGLEEPIEHLLVDTPDDYVGSVIESLAPRKGELQNMKPMSDGRTRIEFEVPTRGLLGFRNELLTLTRGFGLMDHYSLGYGPYRGEIKRRQKGSLIASETGSATFNALLNLQDRGQFFIEPNTEVYKGMVVGENTRPNDLEVNVCKKKQLNNIRSSTSEQTVKIDTPREMSLEQALEYINDDELVEITPNHVRLRKRYLEAHIRNQMKKKQQAMDGAAANS